MATEERPAQPDSEALKLGLAAAGAEAGFLAILALGDLGLAVPEFTAAYFAASIPYFGACYWILRPGRLSYARPRVRAIIWGAAIVFRLTLLPLEPTLTEDPVRYRWQGMLQAAGGDPYSDVPEELRWRGLRDETWPEVTRKDLPSAYGPVLESLHLGWYRVSAALTSAPRRQVWLFKLPFALADLAAAGALLMLLGALGLPRERVLIYLWSPLAIVEFWGQGHNDPLAIALALLALAFAEKRRWHGAFAALAAAVMTKFWPLVLLPFFLLERSRARLRWKPALTGLAVAFALALPYLGTVAEVRHVLAGFAGEWRNNDSLFGLIYHAAGEDYAAARRIAGVLLAATVAAVWFVNPPRTKAALASIAALLFLSANCFPWYLTWVLPLLAIHPRPSLLLWTSTAALAYNPVTGYRLAGVWEYDVTLQILQYVPVAALLAWESARLSAKSAE